jgi:hypothetical protein
MPKRTFTREELRDILWDETGKVILNRMVDQSRWSTHFRFVFKPEDEDKLYETDYSKGSTENQDSEGPWEYEDTVECVEVVAYERTVIDYKPVLNGE